MTRNPIPERRGAGRRSRRFGGVCAVLPLLLIACVSDTGERIGLMPDALGDLKRTEVLRGHEAKQVLNRLHGKSVSPEFSAIAEYRGAAGSATVYVSVFQSVEEAVEANGKMQELIRLERGPFTHYRETTVAERQVSLCLGQGQIHYFFADGRSTYWLGADPDASEDAILELLEALQE